MPKVLSKLTDLPAPSAANDAARKAEVDAGGGGASPAYIELIGDYTSTPYQIDPTALPSGSIINIDGVTAAFAKFVWGTGYSNAYDWTGYTIYFESLNLIGWELSTGSYSAAACGPGYCVLCQASGTTMLFQYLNAGYDPNFF